MTNLRQAAQDVLELVEWIKDNLDVVRAGGDMGISPVLTDKLRAALAEPEQEPTIKWDASAPVLLNNGRLTQYPDGSLGVGTPTPRKPQTTHWEGCEAVHPECKERVMDRDTISDGSKASIIYPGPSVSIQNPVEVMRLSRDGVWINPNLKPDEAAQAVLNSLDAQIKMLVEGAVQAEREECAKVCDEIDRRWINQADKCAAAIRSRA